ncbi:MAG: MBL fold metallo-hydrolase [Bacteroidales bacterium]|nr:MBL fold metallo-hydrolase [Bacteroidales bacterium]
MATLLLAVSCQACGKESNAFVQPEDGREEPQNTGKVELLYMGQASIRIVTETGRVIYIDPFAGSQYNLAADLILVTHEHYDHNKVSLIGKRNDGCRIILAKDAVVDGEHKTFDLGWVKVEAVEAGFNRYHDVRSCVGYVLTFTNGKKVYVSGDTSITDQMSRMSEMHIDYAFLCTDGYFNMGNEEAARAARMIQAKHNIPYHNDTSGQGEMFDRDAAEAFDAPNKMIVLPGESINIE